MTALIVGESAIFTIFVVAYVFYMGKSLSGPTPKQVLEVPMLATICLLSSSIAIWRAEKEIEDDRIRRFTVWLGATIALAALGGIVAPLLWTGLLHSILGFVNPAFNARIAWGWFTLSEIVFGIVAGLVVTRSGKIRTNQTLPFILRMGIEAKEFQGPTGDGREGYCKSNTVACSLRPGRWQFGMRSEDRAAKRSGRADAIRNIGSFDRLYKRNCSACHGENGSGGPALDLSNPKYQALIDDASLKRWITSGMPGTQMAAFGESAGGFLTQQQVDVLVAGMRTRWNQKDRSAAADMPPYFSDAKGNAEAGLDIFRASCASCHQQGQHQITDASYLSLVSDQSLRSIVIAGRPDLGPPDWSQVRHGQPLTDQDVSDVVAYLHSLRSDTPGQPYPETSINR